MIRKALEKRRYQKWKSEHCVRMYQFALEGYSDQQIAAALGITIRQMATWKAKYSGVRYALDEARKIVDKKTKAGNFEEYVFGMLPPKLQKLWRKIDKAKDLEGKQFYTKEKSKAVMQHLFLYAMSRTLFDPTRACKKVGIPWGTYRAWCKDPDFTTMIEQLMEHKKNFCESALMGIVAEGDANAIIFANKSLNKDRGYDDKKMVSMSLNGKIEHDHAHRKIDDLKLPMETRKRILQSLRRLEGVQNIGHDAKTEGFQSDGQEDDYGFLHDDENETEASRVVEAEVLGKRESPLGEARRKRRHSEME